MSTAWETGSMRKWLLPKRQRLSKVERRWCLLGSCSARANLPMESFLKVCGSFPHTLCRLARRVSCQRCLHQRRQQHLLRGEVEAAEEEAEAETVEPGAEAEAAELEAEGAAESCLDSLRLS